MVPEILRKAFVAALLLLLLTTGCRKQTDYDELPVPVAAGLHEVFHDRQRSVSLSFRTIEEYPCGNFQIIYSYKNEQGALSVDFKGLHVPRICATIVGPARAELILDDLGAGSYPVSFSYSQQELQAVFHVSADEFRVELVDDNPGLLLFMDASMHRVPSDFIWGSLRPLEQAPDQGESFFQQLTSSGALPPLLDDGHYGFFRISNGEVWLNPYDDSLPENAQTFVYAWPGELATIEQMMADLSASYDIQVFSAKGHVFVNQEEDKQQK